MEIKEKNKNRIESLRKDVIPLVSMAMFAPLAAASIMIISDNSTNLGKSLLVIASVALFMVFMMMVTILLYIAKTRSSSYSKVQKELDDEEAAIRKEMGDSGLWQ